jgi:hypothetical protein
MNSIWRINSQVNSKFRLQIQDFLPREIPFLPTIRPKNKTSETSETSETRTDPLFLSFSQQELLRKTKPLFSKILVKTKNVPSFGIDFS